MRKFAGLRALPSTLSLFVLLLSAVFSLSACSSGEDDEDTDNAGKSDSGTTIDNPGKFSSGAEAITDLILITGQSNALGTETKFDPVLDKPVQHFYAFTDNGWQLASLRQVWDLGWHPRTEVGTDPHNNFGFHFGKSVVAQGEQRVVGIVLATAPGEGISHWDGQGYFYNQVRNKALAALENLPQKDKFDAVLWHQGETDWSASGSLDPDLNGVGLADNFYSEKLQQLIANFRNDSWFGYNRPFICGETVRSPVNSSLNALNSDADPWTACVASDNLPTYDAAQVHFSAVGLRELGARYADQYLKMLAR